MLIVPIGAGPPSLNHNRLTAALARSVAHDRLQYPPAVAFFDARHETCVLCARGRDMQTVKRRPINPLGGHSYRTGPDGRRTRFSEVQMAATTGVFWLEQAPAG